MSATFATVLTGGSSTAAQARGPLTSEELRKIDQVFAAWDRDDSPGCALGIFQRGGKLLSKGYGVADLASRAPISAASVFDIASVSKHFTAAAILLLVEDGLISLDDGLSRFFPELLGTSAAALKLLDLLHHTSGIRDYLGVADMAELGDFYTPEAALELIRLQTRLNFPTGTNYQYSNSGYFLLGEVVHRVTGQTLRQFSEARLFAPLGMRQTVVLDDNALEIEHRAQGYRRVEGGGFERHVTPLEIVGDGSINISVADFFLWDQNFYDNRLGRGGPWLIDRLQTTGAFRDGVPISYASGLVRDTYRGKEIIRHTGSFAGYKAGYLRVPEHELSVVTLCNLRDIRPIELMRRVLDVVLAEELRDAAPPAYVDLDPSALRELAGWYHSDGAWLLQSGFWRLEAIEGGLALHAAGAATKRLKPVSATEFVAWNPPEPTLRLRFGPNGSLSAREAELGRSETSKIAAPFTETLSDARQAEYRGEYASPEGVKPILITSEAGSLVARFAGYRHELDLAMPDLLVNRDREELGYVFELKLQRDAGGRIFGLTFTDAWLSQLTFARRSQHVESSAAAFGFRRSRAPADR